MEFGAQYIRSGRNLCRALHLPFLGLELVSLLHELSTKRIPVGIFGDYGPRPLPEMFPRL